MSDFHSIIKAWPSLSEFAADVGVEYGTAKQWCRRNSIPPVHWLTVCEAAQARGMEDITVESLAAIAARSRATNEPTEAA